MLPMGQDCRFYFIFIQITNSFYTTHLQFNLTDYPAGRSAALPNEISQCNWRNTKQTTKFLFNKELSLHFWELNYNLHYLLSHTPVQLCTLTRASVISVFNTNITFTEGTNFYDPRLSGRNISRMTPDCKLVCLLVSQ